MPNKFHIESFEPKHLKKAHEVLERHLEEVQTKQNTHEAYRNAFSSKGSLWDRMKKSLGDFLR